MRTSLLLLLAISPAILPLDLACSLPCGFDTEGSPGLVLTIADGGDRDGELGPGAYVFTVTTELGEATWSCGVDAEHPGGQACGTSQVVSAEDDPETDEDEGEASLLLAARVVDGRYLLEMSLLAPGTTTGPELLTVRVERDGAVVGEGMWTPEYELARAGGDGCGQDYVAESHPELELAAPDL